MSRHDAWRPKPLDASALELPDALLPVLERVAEHVHDRWAANRLADGWTWGPKRDDATRQHPCLIPYDELSEEEKAFDRATARETIGALLAMGYRLVR